MVALPNTDLYEQHHNVTNLQPVFILWNLSFKAIYNFFKHIFF